MEINQEVLTSWFARGTLLLSKHSPRLMFIGGLVGVGTATVLACRATLKLGDELSTIQRGVEYTKGVKEHENLPSPYSDKEYHRDLTFIYTKGVLDIIKLYGPALIIGGTAVALLTGSHVTLSKRNAELTATLSALTTFMNEYRGRVRKELGEDRELELYHGIQEEEVELNGKKHLMKVGDPSKVSPYARFFDEYSNEWSKEPGRNKIFLECQQRYFNQLLRVRRHVFLNEVYDNLGIERTKAGNIVGWVIGGEGDNYIDFHIYETNNRMFVHENERSILLDFNVDGVILDLI